MTGPSLARVFAPLGAPSLLSALSLPRRSSPPSPSLVPESARCLLSPPFTRALPLAPRSPSVSIVLLPLLSRAQAAVKAEQAKLQQLDSEEKTREKEFEAAKKEACEGQFICIKAITGF